MCMVIHLGPLTFTGYWLMAVTGVVVSIIYLVIVNRSGRLKPISGWDLINLCCLAMLSIFVGGKLMGVLVNVPDILQNWQSYQGNLPKLWTDLTSGRAFYGGLFLVVVSFFWYMKKCSLPRETVCALFIPAIPLFMVFGRLGCFLAGCCYGIPVSWGIVFPEHSLAPAGIPLFPTQLVEASCHLVMFLVLVWLERRLAEKWLLIPLYIGGYAVIRFVLEFWRGDAERGIWIISSSQWISLAILVSMVSYLVIWNIRKRRIAL